jgi:hypothetical protein
MTGRQTCLKELIYDTTRLRGQLTVKIRHHREIPVVLYEEVWDRNTVIAYKIVEEQSHKGRNP